MARISAEQRRQVRQALLDSAARHFAEHGLAGANINRISVDAGYAKGTIYNYFPSKEALLAAVLESVSAQTLARYRAREVPSDVRGRLLILAEEDAVLVQQHEDFMKTFVRELITARPQTRALIDDCLAPLIAATAEIIAEGQAAGEVRTDQPALALALAFLGQLTMGYISLWRTGGAWPTWEHLPGLTVTMFLDGAQA